MKRSVLCRMIVMGVWLLCAAGIGAAQFVGPKPYKFGIRAALPQPTFPADNLITEEGVALGEALFFEKELSSDRTISCAECHVPSAGFSDGRPVARGVFGRRGRRNSMPLFNLAWRKGFFWDGRATTLREQVLMPIADHKEMNLAADEAVARLTARPYYQRQFAAAFNGPPTTERLALALEQFLLMQISQDSRFDKIMRAEAKPTPLENRGRNLFFTERDPARGLYGADCFHCHGNPLFTSERFADNGLSRPRGDQGRGEVTGNSWEMGQFKVPSLRNVALTAPYMHDGHFRSLRQVVDHYSDHVHQSPNLDPNLAKHQGQLNLSEEDREALVAFLQMLTDDDFIARGRAMELRHGFEPLR